jgi:WD40 repeat protein
MSPDGTRVVTASHDGTARLWDVATGRPVGQTLQHQGDVYCALFSPDGTKVATGSGDGSARVWSAATGEPLSPPLEHALGVYALAFTPDGKKLAVGCVNQIASWAAPLGMDPWELRRNIGTARTEKPLAAIWDLETYAPVALPLRPTSVVTSLAFSADGRRLACGLGDRQGAAVYDPADGKLVAGPFQHPGASWDDSIVTFVYLGPDGQRLVTGTLENRARLWDVAAGKEIIADMPGPKAFLDPTGQWLVGRGLWSAASGKEAPGQPPPAVGWLAAARFGRSSGLVLAHEEAGFRAWDVQAGWKPLTTVLRTRGYGSNRALSPHGRYVVMSGNDHAARLWDRAAAIPALPLLGNRGVVAHYSPDGRRVLTGGGRGEGAALWDAASGRALNVGPMPHPALVADAAFSPDGQFVVTGCSDGIAQVWEAETGKPCSPPLRCPWPIVQCFFDRTGDRVITVWEQVGNQVRLLDVWDARGGRHLWDSGPHTEENLVAIPSPDGRWLATVGEKGAARVWELADGRPVTPELKHHYWATQPAFSPDSRLLATCGGDFLARVWELPSGHQRFALPHGKPVQFAAFSPDGTRLATGDNGGTVRLWSPTTGEPLSPVLRHSALMATLVFSADSRWLFASTKTGTVQAWDAASGERLGPAWEAGGQPRKAMRGQVEVRPDGRQVLLQGLLVPGQLWDFAGADYTPEDWLLLAQVQAGSRIDASGAVVRLTPVEVRETWDELRRRLPAEVVVPREQVRSWYLHEARRLQNGRHLGDAHDLLRTATRDFPDDAELLHAAGRTAVLPKD